MRYIYLIHRWLGIVLGPLVALWLLSGVVMLFVSYPSLSKQMQLDHSSPLQRVLVRYSPTEVWQKSKPAPERILLAMQQQRPVYYFLSDKKWQAIWADTARPVSVNRQVASQQAIAFEAADSIKSMNLIELDQWSFSGKLNAHRPLYRVSLDNAAQRDVYISSRTGEVVLTTSRHERFWNWLGSITHWIYFTELRAQREVWRQVVMWISAAGILLAVLGVWTGILRMRPVQRYSRNRMTPYRGVMRLHHIMGYSSGLILVTWLFSGWLSMTPMNWFSDRALEATELQAWRGNALTFTPIPLPKELPENSKLIEWQMLAGSPVLINHSWPVDQRLHIKSGKPINPLSLQEIQPIVKKLQPAVPLQSLSWLPPHGDAYYRPPDPTTPIARANFSGSDEVTYYIDANTSQIASSQDTRSRYYRWLFSALHTLDFPQIEPEFWRRLLIIILSALGLAITLTGFYYGSKRLAGKL